MFAERSKAAATYGASDTTKLTNGRSVTLRLICCLFAVWESKLIMVRGSRGSMTRRMGALGGQVGQVYPQNIGVHFFDLFYLVVALSTHARTINLLHWPLQPSPAQHKFPKKIDFLL